MSLRGEDGIVYAPAEDPHCPDWKPGQILTAYLAAAAVIAICILAGAWLVSQLVLQPCAPAELNITAHTRGNRP